jgi:hypothetical protein
LRAGGITAALLIGLSSDGAQIGCTALRRFSWDPGDLLSAAVARSVSAQGHLKHGLWAHTAALGPLDTLNDPWSSSSERP